MSELPEALPGEAEPRSWGDRLRDLGAAGATLLQTRMEIFSEELSLKAGFAARGAVAMVVAAGLGIGVLLLLAALLSAILASLFDNVILGILATLVLYALGLGGAGWFGWKQISQVKPGSFPATSAELSSDLAAVRSALSETPEPAGEPGPAPAPRRESPAEDEDAADVEDLEARVRAGAE